MAAYPISLSKCVTKCNHCLSVNVQKLFDLQRFFGSETHRGQARIWGRYSEQPFIMLFLFLFVRNQGVEFGIEIDRAQVQALSRASRLALFVADAVSWFRVRVEICKVSRNKNKILLGQFLSPASQRMCRINKNMSSWTKWPRIIITWLILWWPWGCQMGGDQWKALFLRYWSYVIKPTLLNLRYYQFEG